MTIANAVGPTLVKIRQHKGMSQGDLEKATRLMRCYISRVENGHTVPSLGTLERLCDGLGLRLSDFMHYAEDQRFQAQGAAHPPKIPAQAGARQ